MPDTVYDVQFVDDDALPAELDWALVREPRTDTTPPHKVLFIKEGHVSPEMIRDLWIGLHQVNGTN